MHGQDILESGEIFKGLEPYFTVGEQGEPMLRADHPSDLVIVGRNGLDGGSVCSDSGAVAETAERCKEEATLRSNNRISCSPVQSTLVVWKSLKDQARRKKT
jgi:hypothetical protein